MVRQEFRVEGMSCGHCVQAVRSELTALAVVSDVEVDLESGTATVVSSEPLDHEAVVAAIDAAGYELAS
jgi:copper chaperone